MSILRRALRCSVITSFDLIDEETGVPSTQGICWVIRLVRAKPESESEPRPQLCAGAVIQHYQALTQMEETAVSEQVVQSGVCLFR